MTVLPVAAAPACTASYIPVCRISVCQSSMDKAIQYKLDAKTEPMARVLCTLSQIHSAVPRDNYQILAIPNGGSSCSWSAQLYDIGKCSLIQLNMPKHVYLEMSGCRIHSSIRLVTLRLMVDAYLYHTFTNHLMVMRRSP